MEEGEYNFSDVDIEEQKMLLAQFEQNDRNFLDSPLLIHPNDGNLSEEVDLKEQFEIE